jgi:hypothetical protein
MILRDIHMALPLLFMVGITLAPNDLQRRSGLPPKEVLLINPTPALPPEHQALNRPCQLTSVAESWMPLPEIF